jgi:hypothetical protein
MDNLLKAHTWLVRRWRLPSGREWTNPSRDVLLLLSRNAPSCQSKVGREEQSSHDQECKRNSAHSRQLHNLVERRGSLAHESENIASLTWARISPGTVTALVGRDKVALDSYVCRV